MKRAFTIWQFLFLIAVLVIIAAIVFPVAVRHPESHGNSCQSNLKNIGLAFQQYLQDNNEKFPVVTSSGAAFGWAGALQPYIKSPQVFQCSSETNSQSSGPRVSGYTDYWMNSRLSGQPQGILASSSLTFVSGDGNDGKDVTNARYAIRAIPEAWKVNKTSPLDRHLEGANYGFADGHVKWFQDIKIAQMNPDASAVTGQVTFALK